MSRLYVNIDACRSLATDFGRSISNIQATYDNLKKIRYNLDQRILDTNDIGTRYDALLKRIEKIITNMKGLQDFLNVSATSAESADREAARLFEELVKNTDPILRELLGTGANGTGAVNPKTGTDAPWWEQIGDFLSEHRDGIIAGIALGLIVVGVGILTCGVGDAVLLTALGMGAIGAGSGLAAEEISDYMDDGEVDNSTLSYVGSGVGGFAAGALCPVGGAEAMTAKGVAVAAGKNAVASMAGDAAEQEISTGKVDAKEVAETGAIAGALFGVATVAGGKVSRIVADDPIVTERQLQKSIIDSVENGDTLLKNNLQKGNYGEMKADVLYEDQGYNRISTERVTDLDSPTHQGIDGVYYKSGPPPEYIISEAKYGSSKLSTLSDGTKQMSDHWIENRIKLALGDRFEQYFEDTVLYPGCVKNQLVHINTDNTIDVHTLTNGNIAN